MRFAYIDSQGNEVEIPSEDALRLRIELGAIVAGTSFFDGQSGRWAPAGEHEVFRRLQRELREEDSQGLVPVDQLRPDPLGPPPVRPSRPLTPPADPRDAPPPPPSSGPGTAPPPPSEAEAPAAEDDDDGGFDFGDFGALDLEEAGPVPARSSSPAPESPTPNLEERPDDPTGHADEDPWTVPGRDPWAPELDTPAQAPASLESVGFGDEPAPSDDPPARHPFDADEEVPEWLRDDPEFGEDAPPARTFPTREQVRERYEMDHGSPPPTSGAPRTPRPASVRGGGAPWGRVAAVAGAVVLIGGSAWFFTRGDDAAAASGSVPTVELPPISPSLEPVFRQASERAMAATVDSLRSLPARSAVPDEPHADWLAGRYMAGASGYGDVQTYWEAVGRYVQVMRAREAEVFAAALDAALDTVPLADDDRATVVARSTAGFEAAAPDRDAVYGQVRAVVDAALSLHVFLAENEDAIDYEPANAGLSRDPVLEAVPASDDLGEEMWTRVAEITSSLDQLGFLDRVTTERLLGVFFDKLSAVEVR